jgi:hypothetical protein
VKLGNPALALATDHVIVAVRVTDEDIGVESLPIVLELVAVHPILHAQDAAVSRRRSTPPTMHSRHFAINAFFRLIRRRCGNQRLTFAVRKRTTELSCEGMISILPGSGWIGA